MEKENRNVKIQVRITPSEKKMLDEMVKLDREFTISKMVRETINEKYQQYSPPLTSALV